MNICNNIDKIANLIAFKIDFSTNSAIDKRFYEKIHKKSFGIKKY